MREFRPFVAPTKNLEPGEAGVLELPSFLFGSLMQALPGLLAKMKVKVGNMRYTDAMLHFLPVVVVPFLLVGAVELNNLAMAWRACQNNCSAVALVVVAVSCFAYLIIKSRPKPVYLLDFACYDPGDSLKLNHEFSEYFSRFSGQFTLPSLYFQDKILHRSGLGQETHGPAFMFEGKMVPTHDDAVRELTDVCFGAVDQLLKKTAVSPRDIGILVTNCSLFSPTPSPADLIVNRYRMREDAKVVHLGGMGCSTSVIACDLVKDIMKIYPDQYALVVSTENIGLSWYFGNNKSMLVSNCLFRLGCSAVLLTNKRNERSRSKYELRHCVRTHKAADDRAYRCAYQIEDDTGRFGVALQTYLMGVAADALRTNLTTLAPRILPLSEKLLYAFNLISRHVLKMKIKQYQPDFKLAVQHFCLHAGGRAVIDEVQKNLFLTDELMEPSRCSLHRFGNTSASNLWYVFAYMEAKQNIKKGDKVWMLGLGSGFKCNSAVWQALRDIPIPLFSPWLNCIHRYPEALHRMSIASRTTLGR